MKDSFSAKKICLLLIIVSGFIHRNILFKLYFDDLNDILFHAPTWLTGSYPHIIALMDHFKESMVYLQQNPPIPTFIVGIAIKFFGWPYGATYFFLALQTFLSIASVVLMWHILCLINKHTYLNCAIALTFLFSTDLVIMEYNSLGQTFYENLCMLLLLVLIFCYIKLIRGAHHLRYVIVIAGCTAIMALSRASYSYFFFLPLIFLAFLKKKRFIVIFSVIVLLFQGSWCAKNFWVYRTVSLSTSSWKGINFAHGLLKTGFNQAFIDSILQTKEHYPEWFIDMLTNHGLICWDPPAFQEYIPEEIKQQDEAIQRVMRGMNRTENSIGQRLLSDLYMQAYTRFFFTHPKIILQKFTISYIKFWEPIRNYAIMFIGPLFVYPKVTNSFRLDSVFNAYFKAPEAHFFMGVSQLKRFAKPTGFYTIPFLPIIALMLNIILVHTALLYWFVSLLARLLRISSKKFPFELSFLLAIYLYSMVVMNLPEYPENARFRLSIEPVIWIISVLMIVEGTPVFLNTQKRIQAYWLKCYRGRKITS